MKQRDGMLGGLALRQLEAWEGVAREWPVTTDDRETGQHLTCGACTQTIFAITYLGKPYVLTLNTVLAATVAHLRQAHAYLESEAYGGPDVARPQHAVPSVET